MSNTPASSAEPESTDKVDSALDGSLRGGQFELWLVLIQGVLFIIAPFIGRESERPMLHIGALLTVHLSQPVMLGVWLALGRTNIAVRLAATAGYFVVQVIYWRLVAYELNLLPLSSATIMTFLSGFMFCEVVKRSGFSLARVNNGVGEVGRNLQFTVWNLLVLTTICSVAFGALRAINYQRPMILLLTIGLGVFLSIGPLIAMWATLARRRWWIGALVAISVGSLATFAYTASFAGRNEPDTPLLTFSSLAETLFCLATFMALRARGYRISRISDGIS